MLLLFCPLTHIMLDRAATRWIGTDMALMRGPAWNTGEVLLVAGIGSATAFFIAPSRECFPVKIFIFPPNILSREIAGAVLTQTYAT
jgi:hypothetical protein